MKRSFFLLWLAVTGLVVFVSVYLPSLSHYQELRGRQEEMDRQIADLETKIKAIREERDLLKNDVDYLEKVIRDELGLVKPGEIVYKFVQQNPGQGVAMTGAGPSKAEGTRPRTVPAIGPSEEAPPASTDE